MSTLAMFDYQKYYISNNIDELAEVCISCFWVVEVWSFSKTIWKIIFFLIEYILFLLLLRGKEQLSFFTFELSLRNLTYKNKVLRACSWFLKLHVWNPALDTHLKFATKNLQPLGGSLPLSKQKSLWYRNQPIDLQRKSMGWFLYGRIFVTKELIF